LGFEGLILLTRRLKWLNVSYHVLKLDHLGISATSLLINTNIMRSFKRHVIEAVQRRRQTCFQPYDWAWHGLHENGPNTHLDSSKNLFVVQHVEWPRCITENTTIESCPTLIQMLITHNRVAPHIEWPMQYFHTILLLLMDRKCMSA
jgi:hypothetical protein